MSLNGLRVAIVVILTLTLLEPAIGQTPSARARIVVDGHFDDWKSLPVALTDPADAPEAYLDFRELRVAHDDLDVQMLVDLGRSNVNVMGLDGTVMILFDADGDPQTGSTEYGLPGVDIILDLSPRRPRVSYGLGVAVRSTTYRPEASAPGFTAYDVGCIIAPSHAAQRVELCIKRGRLLPSTPSAFTGQRFVGKLVFIDLDGVLQDETESFTHVLTPSRPPAPVASGDVDPLARSEAASLRVMVWNVANRVTFLPEPFVRTVAAIEPDVLLFNEVSGPFQEVKTFLKELPRAEGAPPWKIVMSKSGLFRTVVASRYPAASVKPLERLPYSDELVELLLEGTEGSQREFFRKTLSLGISTVAAQVEIDDRHLLVVTPHMLAGGRIGSSSDRARHFEAEAIHDAVQAAMAAHRVDAVIIGGDFNLVGARKPLDIMVRGLDVDGSSLAVAEPLQLDGRSNVTWARSGSLWPPGRLDYLIYSDSTLDLRGTFVFDSSDLSDRWLRHYGLRADDSERASDHMPIIADFGWRQYQADR